MANADFFVLALVLCSLTAAGTSQVQAKLDREAFEGLRWAKPAPGRCPMELDKIELHRAALSRNRTEAVRLKEKTK